MVELHIHSGGYHPFDQPPEREESVGEALSFRRACMTKKLTTEEFVARVKLIDRHKGKGYDYSLVNYISNGTKVEIICPTHGPFWQTPAAHLYGSGCQKCYNESRPMRQCTTDKFIQKAIKVGDNESRFSYHLTKFLSSREKVEIVCKHHGPFWQNANSHLCGSGCPKCNTREHYINDAIDARMSGRGIRRLGNIRVLKDKVFWKCLNLTCRHEWPATANNILKGKGCPSCAKRGFSSSKPSVIYVYAINDSYCGYGVTNDFKVRDKAHRLSFKKKNVFADLVATFECSGLEAQRIENLLKKTFEVTDTGIQGFIKEATYLHNLPDVLECINSNLKDIE